MWERRAQEERAHKKPFISFVLTDAQRDNFHNDLFVIFEAGYAKYSTGVLPDGIYQADLITNNLKLYKKFIQDPSTHNLMEQAINLCGFEHLIEIETLKGAIAKAVDQKKTDAHQPSPDRKPNL